MEGLRLVSRQFRKQRLAVWAAGRGARSVLHCHGVLALRDRPLCGALSSESNVWQYGLLAAGPIRTSLPLCFGSARPSYHTAFRLR